MSVEFRRFVPVAVVVVALSLSGACAPEPSGTAPGIEESATAPPPVGSPVSAVGEDELERAEELARREAELAERERELAAEEERLRRERELAREREALAAREAEIEAREREIDEQERRTREEEEARRIEEERLEREQARRAEAERSAREAERAERERRARAAELAERSATTEATRRVQVDLPAGSVIEVELLDRLSSQERAAGDRFAARVARDVLTPDGIVAVREGAIVQGKVTEVRPLRKVGGQAALGFEFTDLVLEGGDPIRIRATYAEEGTDQKGDKKKILLGAAAGAVLGALFGGDGVESAAAGAAAGAAASTGYVLSNKGEPAVVERGTILALRLEEVVTVETEMTGVAPR